MVLPSPIRWMEGEIAGSKPLGCLCNLPIKKCWTIIFYAEQWGMVLLYLLNVYFNIGVNDVGDRNQP